MKAASQGRILQMLLIWRENGDEKINKTVFNQYYFFGLIFTIIVLSINYVCLYLTERYIHV